jgi:hypothetical protein
MQHPGRLANNQVKVEPLVELLLEPIERSKRLKLLKGKRRPLN